MLAGFLVSSALFLWLVLGIRGSRGSVLGWGCCVLIRTACIVRITSRRFIVTSSYPTTTAKTTSTTQTQIASINYLDPPTPMHSMHSSHASASRVLLFQYLC